MSDMLHVATPGDSVVYEQKQRGPCSAELTRVASEPSQRHVEAFYMPPHWRTALYSAEATMPVHTPYEDFGHIFVAIATKMRVCTDGFTSNEVAARGDSVAGARTGSGLLIGARRLR